jgi:hypothetical protein
MKEQQLRQELAEDWELFTTPPAPHELELLEDVPTVQPILKRMLPKIVFTPDQVEQAANEWGFNCGPGALCAALNLTPDELRPHLLDFESKGYTNPSLMHNILGRLKVPFRTIYRADEQGIHPRPSLGLMRVQWGGPWTQPGVPMGARYRQTHWVALADDYVFDINAIHEGGWLFYAVWKQHLVPWLMNECCPRGDRTWWATHVLELNLPRKDKA